MIGPFCAASLLNRSEPLSEERAVLSLQGGMNWESQRNVGGGSLEWLVAVQHAAVLPGCELVTLGDFSPS